MPSSNSQERAPLLGTSKATSRKDVKTASTRERGSTISSSSTASTFSQLSVFDDPALVSYFTPPDEYEGRHRFDPSARWTEEEEQAVVRKIDVKICAFVCLCFAALQLDRGNLSQALSDDLLRDLSLTPNDYNMGQTIFYLSFLCAELPSQLLSKAVGVDRWGWLKGKASFFLTRGLLGALEGVRPSFLVDATSTYQALFSPVSRQGFIPEIVMYLSYFYKSSELSWRLSFFWASLTITTIFGSFAAAVLLQLRGLWGLEGWRHLFIWEGIVTLGVGIFALFWLPPGPVQTSGGLRGDGWFNEKEETIIVMRVLRDDPSKSSMHNREAMSIRDLLRSFGDYDHWPLYLLGITTFIAPHTVSTYFTLTLKSLGFTTIQTNLLTIPSQIFFITNNFLLSYLS
ncbi:MFS general substrate transporter, partial [Meredithblackwellia eburnea MCA 4105]